MPSFKLVLPMKKTSLKEMLRQALNPEMGEAKAQERAGKIALGILAVIVFSPILLVQGIIYVFKAIFAFGAHTVREFIAQKLGIKNENILNAIMFFVMLGFLVGVLFLAGFAGRLYKNSKISLGSVTQAVIAR